MNSNWSHLLASNFIYLHLYLITTYVSRYLIWGAFMAITVITSISKSISTYIIYYIICIQIRRMNEWDNTSACSVLVLRSTSVGTRQRLTPTLTWRMCMNISYKLTSICWRGVSLRLVRQLPSAAHKRHTRHKVEIGV